MSEIRFHPGDPTRRTRSLEVGARGGWLLATFACGTGALAACALTIAPSLMSDLIRSADRLALRETAQRGVEAYESVTRQVRRLAEREAADELFLARVATLVDASLPAGFPGDAPPEEPFSADELEVRVAVLARRVRAFETFRRRLVNSTHDSVPDLALVPSRSPVEPNSAVPIAVFGPRISPLTRRPETFTGLSLASVLGSTVSAPASGTVLFAGNPRPRAGSGWRALGTVIVLSHGERCRTIYGHLGKVLVRTHQTVRRGEALARVGQSGWAAAPQLHYEVRRSVEGRFVPSDPRLYILDVDWISAAEVRRVTPSSPEDDLSAIP